MCYVAYPNAPFLRFVIDRIVVELLFARSISACCISSSRCANRWPKHTPRASCIETSSRRISMSRRPSLRFREGARLRYRQGSPVRRRDADDDAASCCRYARLHRPGSDSWRQPCRSTRGYLCLGCVAYYPSGSHLESRSREGVVADAPRGDVSISRPQASGLRAAQASVLEASEQSFGAFDNERPRTSRSGAGKCMPFIVQGV